MVSYGGSTSGLAVPAPPLLNLTLLELCLIMNVGPGVAEPLPAKE